jgi:hypothetical protein
MRNRIGWWKVVRVSMRLVVFIIAVPVAVTSIDFRG